MNFRWNNSIREIGINRLHPAFSFYFCVHRIWERRKNNRCHKSDIFFLKSIYRFLLSSFIYLLKFYDNPIANRKYGSRPPPTIVSYNPIYRVGVTGKSYARNMSHACVTRASRWQWKWRACSESCVYVQRGYNASRHCNSHASATSSGAPWNREGTAQLRATCASLREFVGTTVTAGWSSPRS